ncbi:MAG TPA: diadenylate cyclase CdaA [Chitinophagales bacterium]|nr:diadenylate cyclase CdaA [Chitinophagales bacterium]
MSIAAKYLTSFLSGFAEEPVQTTLNFALQTSNFQLPTSNLFLAFKIGFLELDFIDLVDAVLVALLIYMVYRLLKGSLAFNIFIGMLLVYLIWFSVRALEMELLQGIIGKFIDVGVIALLIVFQPEVRKFLLFIGRESNPSRFGSLMRNIFSREKRAPVIEQNAREIATALGNLSQSKTGAIIVLSVTSRLQFYANTGVLIEGVISSKLLESIFEKNSPLHDGAVIIAEMKIIAAGCVLPVSDNPDLPSRLGLRHRATVGITEHSDAMALVVSEENGQISCARNGKLEQNISMEEVNKLLVTFFQS